MPEDTETLNDDKSSDDQLEEIANRLEQRLDQKSTSETTLANLVADPDIRKILDMKQKGETVRILSGEEEDPKDEPDESVEIDSMTNAELMLHMAKINGKVMDKVKDDIVKDLKESLSGVNDFVQQQKTEAVQGDIKKSREKYKDFDDYKEKMLEVHQRNPGLNVEELYLVAKMQSGGLDQPGAGVGSEKPTQVGTLPVRRTEKKKSVPSGRRGMRQLLDEAVEKVVEGAPA